MQIPGPSEIKAKSALEHGVAITRTAAERWDEQMRAWQQCQAATGRRGLSAWESARAARRYWEQVCSYQQERLNFLISRLQPAAGKRILDIGSGPGVMAIPLAESGARVTAVDPSPAMLELLKHIATERGVAGINCLAGRWEELDTLQHLDGNLPYQAVVASLSLLMVGIRDCLLKMMQACSSGGKIYLLWGRGKNHWTEQLSQLYPELYGFQYLPKPGAGLLLEVVLELREGLAGSKTNENCRKSAGCDLPSALPEVEAEEVDFIYRESFDSATEALAHFLDYFGVEEADRPRVAIIEEFLRRNLKTHNGSLLLEHPLPALLITISI
ncbi:MAG: class I SAM-dependent methyltransferase [Candidatus Aminicenantes bacterium]|nr:class I SAM-dependent methyltransferase [Candidatus Aminicenantes bacterium]